MSMTSAKFRPAKWHQIFSLPRWKTLLLSRAFSRKALSEKFLLKSVCGPWAVEHLNNSVCTVHRRLNAILYRVSDQAWMCGKMAPPSQPPVYWLSKKWAEGHRPLAKVRAPFENIHPWHLPRNKGPSQERRSSIAGFPAIRKLKETHYFLGWEAWNLKVKITDNTYWDN